MHAKDAHVRRSGFQLQQLTSFYTLGSFPDSVCLLRALMLPKAKQSFLTLLLSPPSRVHLLTVFSEVVRILPSSFLSQPPLLLSLQQLPELPLQDKSICWLLLPTSHVRTLQHEMLVFLLFPQTRFHFISHHHASISHTALCPCSPQCLVPFCILLSSYIFVTSATFEAISLFFQDWGLCALDLTCC